MPPPMVTCSICGEQVVKAQTYATGAKAEDGTPLRACKSHEGVAEKAEELRKMHEQEIKRQERSMEARTPGFARYMRTHTPEQIEKTKRLLENARDEASDIILNKAKKEAEWANTHCWLCGREGMSLQDANFQVLVEREKMDLKGEDWLTQMMNGDMAKRVRDKLWADNHCVFVRFSVTHEQLKLLQEWKSRFRRNIMVGIEFAGIVQLCHECQERTRVAYTMPDIKQVDLKTLHMIGIAYESSGLKEKVQAIAKDAVVKETEKN